MAGINKVILVGRLGKDPEVRYTSNGIPVANFSVATSNEWKDKETGEKRERVEWHRIEVWRGLAQICGKYLHKGSQVYLEGEIKTDPWEDKDGVKRYTTKVVVHVMQMLGDAPKRTSNEACPKDEDAPPDDIPDDDIPF